MPWADVLFFTDSGWYDSHRSLVDNWPGLVVSFSRAAKRENPDKIHRVIGETRNRFRNLGATSIRQGRSSGQSAIALAVALGAATVVLLGFDMKPDEAGRTHEHDDYDRPTHPTIFANEFLPAFQGWNQQALDAGVRILNATVGSAITEFPLVNLKEFLAQGEIDYGKCSLSVLEAGASSRVSEH